MKAFLNSRLVKKLCSPALPTMHSKISIQQNYWRNLLKGNSVYIAEAEDIHVGCIKQDYD